MQSAYTIGLLAIYAASLLVLVLLFFVTAPYGRYQRRGWGPAIAERWAWVVMELPAIVMIVICALLAPRAGHQIRLVPVIFLCLWQAHYLYRTFVFPALMRGGEKRFPIVIILFALIYNTSNGFVNGYNLFLSGRVYSVGWLSDGRFIGGFLLFVTGLLIHAFSDRTLRRLRRVHDEGYGIPRGGLFEFISAPNYFGEMLQWVGWAVMTWSFAGLSFAVFTIANLLPRGLRHHRWYRETFDDYPDHRRAVVPFVL
jgi:protein-S-isoprenylcysteine O-methyltransferase Ste14